MKSIALLLMAWLSVALPQDGKTEMPTHWDSRLHQYAIAKATGLMPDFLQRQILKHRQHILRGCVDVLREDLNATGLTEQVQTEFRAFLSAVEAKIPFSEVCYRLGRLSCLTTEISAPVRSIRPSSVERFNAFMVNRLESFPLMIVHRDEAGLAKGELAAFLKQIEERNRTRAVELLAAMDAEEMTAWQHERSLVYGLAQLIYNDMVTDTARIWLFAWEQAGGSVAGAPYFDKREQE